MLTTYISSAKMLVFPICLNISSIVDSNQSIKIKPIIRADDLNPNLTHTKNNIEATCGGSTASINWSFDGERSILEGFRLNDTYASKDEIEKVNKILKEIGGNINSKISCYADSSFIYFYNINGNTGSKYNMVKLLFSEGKFLFL